MLRTVKIIPVALILVGPITLLAGCGSASDAAKSAQNQVATVQRGNLTIDITAAGNLALSRTEDLAFELAGTVEEVLVEAGESVEEGQVLARLDTSDWEEQLKALEQQLKAVERGLTAKERNLSVKQHAVTTAERNLATKERAVGAKELALRQAQISLQTAEYNLNEIADVEKAQDAVDAAEYDLKFAQAMWEKAMKLESPGAEISYWRDQIVSAKTRLAEAQQELKEVLAGSGVKVTTEVAREVATKKLAVEQAQRQVEDAQIAIEDAQIAIEDAQIAVEDAQIAVEDARIDVEDAREAVADAQKALDEAKSTSPQITAPFAGFISKVNIKGGDEVKKGTVAVTLADPTKFEADILVNEANILSVKLGGNASVQVDAMQGMSLPAKVTHISPTAIIQSGVVNYKVKVEIQSVEAVVPERQQASREAMQQRQQGQEGQQRQMPQGEGTPPGQVPTMLPENFQLREGLTVTVSIIVEQKSDVLLVPRAAIVTKGRRAYVQVMTPGGTIEERAIQTGISDWQSTEVTSGLTEGEKVIVPRQTTTTSTGSQQRQPPGGMVPGIPRMIR